MKTKLTSTTKIHEPQRRCQRVLALLTALAFIGVSLETKAQSFTDYPTGDDVTTSMGQFQIVLDSRWVKVFDDIVPNSPLGTLTVTRRKGLKLYKKGGTFTSPTLFDFQTRIGRSDSFVVGSPAETLGTIAGQAPGRTYVKQGQIVLHPTWAPPVDGAREIHTFLKSMNMTDQLTTHLGFSVKAGMLAPKRPVCAGQVEGGGTGNDFPANSFFNVYVQVTIPGGGGMPTLELVNVDPLLVQQTNINYFPPHVIYQHENPAAVPVYFNTNTIIHDPKSGQDIFVPRGTLFGQLTLAGHGVNFSSVEVEPFQVEFEDESNDTNSVMPLTIAPITNLTIVDYSPDYNAAPRSITGGQFVAGGSFMFTILGVEAGTTNYLQACDSLGTPWQTIATVVPATNTFTFTDPGAINNPKRFYRLSLLP